MAKLPIFVGLRGRRAAVIGGSEPAAWKAELLAAAGARVDAASLNLALTQCDCAQRVFFLTEHDQHGSLLAGLEVAALAARAKTVRADQSRLPTKATHE